MANKNFSLSEAAYLALEEHRPFSLWISREVRYWGNDKAVVKMRQRQHRDQYAHLLACRINSLNARLNSLVNPSLRVVASIRAEVAALQENFAIPSTNSESSK